MGSIFKAETTKDQMCNGTVLPHPESLVNGSTVQSSMIKQNGTSSVKPLSNAKTVKSGKWGLVPHLVPTKTKEEVPVLFREPHVERGFRELHQPWSYYFWSVFQLHNESVNVWTHLLAFSLMTTKLMAFWDHVNFIDDPYAWPLLAGLSCGIALYAFSSGAHCLQSKSEMAHYVAFMVDYSGIGLYGLGSIIVHLTYCSENVFYEYVKSFFIPLGGILAFLICYCCTIAKTMYDRPYPFQRKLWQMCPVASIYVVLVAPIAHRLFTCYVWGEDCNESIPYHVQQIIWFLISGVFFASEFPQKWRPGLCDHFFHSHQLFHVTIMICTLIQMDAVFVDFQTRSEIFRNRPSPTFASAFGPVIMVAVVEVIFILLFALRITKKLKKVQD